MADVICAVASDTKLETPEGPLTAKSLAAKPAPVFTFETGRVRFRMLGDPRVVGASAPVVRVTLANGASFRVGTEQIVFKKGMVECRAADLAPGDALVPAFTYLEGYEYRDDASASTFTSAASLLVSSVAADGEAEIYSFTVNVSGCFFVSAGVLCKAAAA